jgi:hypothetical protein
MSCPTSIVPGLDRSIKSVKGQAPGLEMKLEQMLNMRVRKKLPKKPQPPLTS